MPDAFLRGAPCTDGGDSQGVDDEQLLRRAGLCRQVRLIRLFVASCMLIATLGRPLWTYSASSSTRGTLCTTFSPRSGTTRIRRSSTVRTVSCVCDAALTIISTAAFEVYVRRAYKAYTLLSVDYEEGDGMDDGDAPNVITWRFNLGQSNSPPSTPRLGRE